MSKKIATLTMTVTYDVSNGFTATDIIDHAKQLVDLAREAGECKAVIVLPQTDLEL